MFSMACVMALRTRLRLSKMASIIRSSVGYRENHWPAASRGEVGATTPVITEGRHNDNPSAPRLSFFTIWMSAMVGPRIQASRNGGFAKSSRLQMRSRNQEMHIV